MEEAINYNRFLGELARADAMPGRTIVDFGAGIGTFSPQLATSRFPVTCVEADARLRGGLENKGLPVRGSLDELPNGSVDYLYSLNVLEHIEDDAAIVHVWARKLRPGGRLLVYVPAFNILFSSMDRKVGHFRRYKK